MTRCVAGARRAAAAAAAALLAACSGASPIGPVEADLDQDGIADAEEGILAAQYRPYWMFDGAEALAPVSVAEWAELGGFLVSDGAVAAYDDLASLLSAVLLFPSGTLNLPAGPITGTFGTAPVYVEAVPMPAGFAVGGKTDLVWLTYYLLFADDVKEYFPPRSHRGDWEHLCVLAERSAAGDPARPPVMIHWHHHGSADIAAEAETWHADAAGAFHPRAYVERGGHAMYRARPPAPPPDPGPSPGGDPLDDPIVFLREHDGQPADAEIEGRIVREFLGLWGQTANAQATSPRGPLVFNGVCDHDYVAAPTPASFALTGCEGP